MAGARLVHEKRVAGVDGTGGGKGGLARVSTGSHLGARLDIVHHHSMSGRVDQGRVIEETNLAPVA